MHTDGQHPGQPHTTNDQRWHRGNAIRHRRWPFRIAMMRLPGRQQRALDRIEQTLVAEDPGLGSRFAVFTRLTRHEAMPGTEQVPARKQRFGHRAVTLPLIVICLVALVAASWLTPSSQACPAGQKAAAPGMSPLSRAARCQPGPAIKLDTMRMR
jgi:hypothetical protein